MKPFAPPVIYRDERNIYLEWGSYVQKFPFSEGGLSKALSTIPNVAMEPGYISGGSNIADKLLTTRKAKIARKTSQQRAVAKITDSQMSTIRNGLRKLRDKA